MGIDHLIIKIQSQKDQLLQHSLYEKVKSVDDLRIFLENHIFAVWDFMSLLKGLQNQLTCTNVPWFPVGDAETRYLINEIVVGEEADVDMDGVRKSHFEIYLDAMLQSGASVNHIKQFVKTLIETKDFEKAYAAAHTPKAAADFVNFTFNTINSNKAYLQAAVFTFGREDLIPGMFHAMVSDLDKNLPNSITKFKYYLERHIEVDGGHHSHLALQMTANLCGDNQQYWDEAEQATIIALQKRIALWDSVYESIVNSKTAVAQ